MIWKYLKEFHANICHIGKKGIVKSVPSIEKFSFADKISIFIEEGDIIQNSKMCV